MATKRSPFTSASDGDTLDDDKTVLDEDEQEEIVAMLAKSNEVADGTFRTFLSVTLLLLALLYLLRLLSLVFSSPRPQADPSPPSGSSFPTALSHLASAASLVLAVLSLSVEVSTGRETGKEIVEEDWNPRDMDTRPRLVTLPFGPASFLLSPTLHAYLPYLPFISSLIPPLLAHTTPSPSTDPLLLEYIPLVVCALAGYAAREMRAVWSGVKGLEARRYKVKGA
ncbi:hypothetical protein M427DRAFT_59822 [Gonapodya prolifera JEL478]|uniref:Uncharacterized protein n=1 Tax=Gonapodya prolifera (strain JEL478) TaxID=1344416 RepID=A0A139A5X5_GONPJ|nr:hypothetical protein M427DRAFT_59822 [Gonapodya prolifera JEL478]|eukprot:KXS12141.1 hypothetical protein M427DRAFT_59822 [Gonapodya prolifera JEL478]